VAWHQLCPANPATLSVVKARLTSRTSDELHLVAQLSGLSCPLLTGTLHDGGVMLEVLKNG
jgi:hypothetical protein